MRSKAVIASALLLTASLVIGISWSWISSDRPPVLSEVEEATEADGARHEQRGNWKRERSAVKPAPSNPSRTRSAPESNGLESEIARSRSPSRRTGVALEGREPARRPRAVDARDQGGAVDDNEDTRKSEDLDRFKELLDSLRGAPQEGAGGEDPDTAPLNPEDLDRLDLDGDQIISPWELDRAEQLVQRAERHPEKNDLEDGAYPIERQDYRRPQQEFDVIDTNRDGVIDVEEYYSFLFNTLRESVLLDSNGDRLVSLAESGMSEDEFALLDSDNNGYLTVWQIRQAFAREVWPRGSE